MVEKRVVEKRKVKTGKEYVWTMFIVGLLVGFAVGVILGMFIFSGRNIAGGAFSSMFKGAGETDIIPVEGCKGVTCKTCYDPITGRYKDYDCDSGCHCMFGEGCPEGQRLMMYRGCPGYASSRSY